MMKFKNIFFISILVLFSFMLAGCNEKEKLTTGNFKTKMEEQGYIVTDATNQFDTTTIDTVYIGVKNNYQIEFYTVPTDSQAITAFEQNKTNFQVNKTDTSIETSSSKDNYAKYTLETDTTYYVTSRVNNTYIFIKTDKQNKSDVDETLKNLGY